MLGVDVIVSAMSEQEFNDMVARTRQGGAAQ